MRADSCNDWATLRGLRCETTVTGAVICVVTAAGEQSEKGTSFYEVSYDPNRALDPDAGTPEPVDMWMSVEQFQLWKHTQLTIDLVPGPGAGFSLEAPTGHRFLIRSRLFTDERYVGLGESPASQVGVQSGR